MAGVFLSYDREDLPRARSLALALGKAGHAVWWDRNIKGGAQYSKEIEQALQRAEAVVVLWSRNSIDSAWVRDEAAAARDAGRLVPARLDQSEPPLGFRQYHTIDLSRWKGGSRVPKLAELLSAIEGLGIDAGVQPATEHPGEKRHAARPLLAFGLIALALIAAALFLWGPWNRQSSTPLVAVRAADTSVDAQSLARNLLVQLGNVQSSQSDAVQLIEDSATERPDLIIEVSGHLSGPAPSANLLLLRGKDRKLLSSQEFAASGATGDDLRESLAMSASRLLGCAAEALRPVDGLPQDLHKLYIDACGRFGMLYGSEDVAILLPQFRQVIQREPEFAPAWKLLLLSEAYLRATPTDQEKPTARLLRADIGKARRVDAALPEIGIAELALVQVTDFQARMEHVENLVRRFPDNVFVLGVLADELMLVGRMNEAVVNAERAAMLDPISPFTRSAHIRALAYSGRIPRAFEELDKAAPLALGAKTLIEPRFRLNMRYGDPRIALQLLRTHGTSKQHEAFLLARIDPSPANVAHAIAISRATAKEMGFFGSHFEVLAAFGRNDDVYQTLMALPPERIDQGVIMVLFRPNLKNLRQDPRFINVAARFRLLDYWRHSGKWPDFCSDPDLPYDCRTEAARIAAGAN